MLQAHGRRRLVRLVGFAVGVVLVAGQDQSGRLDILTGTDGESSCQLRDSILTKCDSTTSLPGLDVTPTPTSCTCNKVYFNIWSACSYASGNNTLPVFRSWAGRCTNSSVDLSASSAKASTSGGLGINAPAWSFLDIPGNTSFDLQQAVVQAHDSGPKRWTLFQILAPVISAIVGAISCLVLIYFYRSRRGSRFSIKDKVRSIFRPVHRVRPINDTAPRGWVIDQSGAPATLAVVPRMVDPYSPLETHRRDTILTVPGNPSNPASAYNDDGREQSGTAKVNFAGVGGTGGAKPPGGRIFVESHQPGSSQSTSHARESSRPSTTSLFVDRVRQIRVPWKIGPVPVREIRPGRRFEVDAVNRIGMASEDTLPSFTSWGPERPRGSFDVHRHETNVDADDFGTVEEMDDHGSETEGTNLITDEERQSSIVMDIRRSSNARKGNDRSSGAASNSVGHESSINSSVKIVSPSTSSGSPRDSNPGSGGLFSFLNRISVPPVPRLPAPLPPPGRQVAKPRNGVLGLSSAPIGAIPPGRVMSPILEHPASEPAPEERRMLPTPLHVSTTPTPPEPEVRPVHAASSNPHPLALPPTATTAAPLPPRRPSFDSRPLPLPGIAAGPSTQSNNLTPHSRSLSQSHTPTSGSVYEEGSSIHHGSNDGPRFEHARSRSPSSDSVPAVGSPLRPGQRSLTRPLPTPTTPNTPNPNASNTPQGRTLNGSGLKTQTAGSYLHYDTHQRSASGSSVSLATSHHTTATDPVSFRDPWAGSSSASASAFGGGVVNGGGGGHGRGLSFDDGASFYLTAPDGPVVPSRRSPSPQEEQGDPRMLFPASVRGAGYWGTPNTK